MFQSIVYWLIAAVILVVGVFYYLHTSGKKLSDVLSNVVDFPKLFTDIKQKLGDGFAENSRLFDRLRSELLAELIKLGDKIDGKADGKFSLADLEDRIVERVVGELKQSLGVLSSDIEKRVTDSISSHISELHDKIEGEVTKVAEIVTVAPKTNKVKDTAASVLNK